MKQQKLKDITDVIQTGVRFRGKVVPNQNGNTRLIQLKDIDQDRQIKIDSLTTVEVPKPEQYEVKQNDVLFLSRGHHLYATVVPQLHGTTVAAGYFYTIKPTAAVVPGYLSWALNQSTYQHQIRPLVTRSAMPVFSIENFKNSAIPLPSLKIQEQIVTLNGLQKREAALLHQLVDLRSKLVNQVSHTLLAPKSKQKR